MSISFTSKITAAAAVGLLSAACGGSAPPAESPDGSSTSTATPDEGTAAGDPTKAEAGCKGEDGCQHKGECKAEGECKANGKCKGEGECKAEGKCKGEDGCNGHAPE